MAVTLPNAILFLGINHYQEPCPKCEGPLVEKKLKKGVQVQCTNVITKKNHKVKVSRLTLFFFKDLKLFYM